MKRLLNPSGWEFWIFIACGILGITVVVGQIQNANRVNEIENLVVKQEQLARQNRLLFYEICTVENRSNELLSEAIYAVVLNQPNLNSLVVDSFTKEVEELRPVKCVR